MLGARRDVYLHRVAPLLSGDFVARLDEAEGEALNFVGGCGRHVGWASCRSGRHWALGNGGGPP